MKKILFSLFLTILSLNLLAASPTPQDDKKDKKSKDAAAAASQKEEPKGLSAKDKERQRKALQKELDKPFEKWLKEDVTYIITDEEKAAWKRFSTAEERESFIEQ